MKVELAENQSEITLAQYQEYSKLYDRDDLSDYELDKRKVKIFTGLNYKQISEMKYTDLRELVSIIDEALNKPAEFTQIFEMNGVEFGFLPNFDDMKAKEYFDLSTYDTKAETLHKLMAILFRPIKQKVGKDYEIVNYKGTKEWCEAMKQMPLSVVNGALLFFSNLANELEIATLRFTAEEVASQMLDRTSRSGDGTQRFTNWLRVKCGGLITSKN